MTRRSLASDTAYNTASFVIRMVGVIIALAWVARSLGPEGQGRFGFVHWLAAILGQLVLWGLGVAATRFVARSLGASNPVAARAVVDLTTRWLTRTIAAFSFLAVPAIWSFGGELRIALFAALPLLIAVALYQWRIGVAWGLRRFDIALVGHLVFFTLLLPMLGFGLSMSEPVVGALLSFATARAVHCAVVWWWTERALDQLLSEAGLERRTPESFPQLAPTIRSYALQMAVVAFFGAVLWERSELPFLKVSSDYEQIGLYTAAFAIAVLFLRVPGVLAQVVLPVVSEMEGARAGPEVIGDTFARAARLLTLLVASPIVLLWVGAADVVHFLYGTEYAGSVVLLRILLLPLLLTGLGAAGSKTLVGGGQHHRLVRITANAAAVKLLLCLALVPELGALGAAVAVAVAFSGGLIAVAWVATGSFPTPDLPPTARWTRQAAVALTAGSCGWLACFLVDPELSVFRLLTLGVGGALGMLIAARIMQPLTHADGKVLSMALEKTAGARLLPLLQQISARRPN
ncbi:MAG: polysaccharide biosynthesis C-terminal domain-containing protein [Myxococcota bacterium]|nr:polysaccharide biosynthesis C-terminal domain-containing protein [Myxococcota bacterium]